MTYTAVNPHACCNWPRPEDAHAAARPPPHPHASPHLTNNDGLRWKTDGLPPTNGPPTATPQQRRHSPSTPARGPPRPPTPRPTPQPPPPPNQSQGQVPITEQNFWYIPPTQVSGRDILIGAYRSSSTRGKSMSTTGTAVGTPPTPDKVSSSEEAIPSPSPTGTDSHASGLKSLQ
jgi:hypothetical protein